MMDKIFNNVFAILCVLLLVVGAGLVTIKVAPIQVLRNFTIKTDQTTYTPGQTIVITSNATKLRKASGDVHRTIECNSSGNKVVGYTINSQEATAKPGKSTKPYNIIVPNQIANLPATCRLVVSVNYHIFTIGRISLRTINQYTVSNDFTVQ